MLYSLSVWLHDHALILEALLIVFSAWVALYADLLRHFFSLPPQKLGTWLLKARLLSVNAKIFNLCECQNNAFATIIYVSRTFILVLALASLFLGGILLEVVAVRSGDRGDPGVYTSFHAHLDISLALVFVVVACSRLLLLGEFLYRLRNFKGYDHRLMERVADLEQRLGISTSDSENNILTE